MLVGIARRREAAGTFRITEILADPPTGVAVTIGVHAPARGRHQQVGPAPLPLLAPVGHGGADPGQRLPARRVDGQGRRLPRRAAGARVRRRDRVAHGAPGARPRDDAPRRLSGAPPVRHQAAARLRHRQPARLPRARPRHRHPRRDARRARPADRTRAVQGDPVPRRRRRSTTAPARATSASCPGSVAPAAGPRRHRDARRPRRWRVSPRCIGFVAKESVLVALVDVARDGDGTGIGTAGGWLLVVGVVVGSILTAAYSARFVWGAFGNREVEAPVSVHSPSPAFIAAPVILAALSLVLGFLGAPLTSLLDPQADKFPPGAHEPELSLWHGVGLPLVLTLVTLAAGAALFVAREPVARLQAALVHDWSLERAYRGGMRLLDRTAVEVTGVVQRGSAAAYLAIILIVLVLLPGSTLIGGLDDVQVIGVGQPRAGRHRRRHRRGSHHDGALAAPDPRGPARRRHRLRHGPPLRPPGRARPRAHPGTGRDADRGGLRAGPAPAPRVLHRPPAEPPALPAGRAGRGRRGRDRRLPPRGRRGAHRRPRLPGVAEGGARVRRRRQHRQRHPGRHPCLGHARRALGARRRSDRRREPRVSQRTRRRHPPRPRHPLPGRRREGRRPRPGRRAWLPGPRTLPPDKRSIIFEVIVRLLFHTLVVSRSTCCSPATTSPAAASPPGMVTGLALVVRYLAGGRYELDEAAPVDAGRADRRRACRRGAGGPAAAGLRRRGAAERGDRPAPAAAGRRAPGHLGPLRRRRLPGRRRAGARPAAQPSAPASTATSAATSGHARGGGGGRDDHRT